jgi:hypothetical protein
MYQPKQEIQPMMKRLRSKKQKSEIATAKVVVVFSAMVFIVTVGKAFAEVL